MAYTSLYRKYRPDTFDKVIGQDHIVRTLRNQLASDNIGHAYIFTGTRGTGKTSVAKIFARAVNCEHPLADGSPCGECEVCKGLLEPSNFDILEIDAASNNSVDQIRDLTDRINFPPTVGKFKVYIVDEVHMLSKAAFNALLKTLEEPPQHAIFILATTEIQMIPQTILSRCMRFDFRLVPNSLIAEHLSKVLGEMGVKFEKEALELIAASGAGSVRDALSIADTCVSYCSGNITYGGVLEVLGASDPKKLRELADYILCGNTDKALALSGELVGLGKSVSVLANDLATLFGNVLYIKTCSAAKQLLMLPDSVYAGLAEIAGKYPAPRVLSAMKIMGGLDGELRYSTQHRIVLEGAIVSACLASDGTGAEELAARVAVLERTVKALQKSGFNSPPAIKDARQVWLHLASELKNRNNTMLLLTLQDAEFELNGNEFVIKVGSHGTYLLLCERSNREALNIAFGGDSYMNGLTLSIKEEVVLDDDKVVPYIKEMFGNLVEIK